MTQAEIDKLNNELSQTQAQISTEKNNLTEAQAIEAALQQKVDDAQKALEQADTDVSSKTQALADAKLTLEKFRDDSQRAELIAQAEADVANATQAVATAEPAVTAAQEALADAEKESAAANTVATNAAALLAEKQQAVDAKSADMANIQAQGSDQSKEKARLTQELNAALAAQTQAQQAVATAQANLTAKQAEIAQAKTELEQKRALLQTELQNIEASKATAKAQWDQGSRGFFEAMGSTEAITVFTTEKTPRDGTSYLDKTRLGWEFDSTNLDNMKASLAYLQPLNDIRAKEGGIDGRKLTTLKVTDYNMAIAQHNANWSRDKVAHASVYNPPYENLSWGSSNPYDGWFYKEREVFNAARAKGYTDRMSMEKDGLIVGHYTNLVDDLMWGHGFGGNDNQTMGYAYHPNTTGDVFTRTDSVVVDFSTKGTAYSVADYITRFNTYYDDLKEATLNGTKESRGSYDALLAEVTALEALANQDITVFNNAVATAETAKTAADQAVTTTRAKIDAINREMAHTANAMHEIQQQLISLRQELEVAKTEKQTADNALTLAQENETAKQTQLTAAVDQLQVAQAALAVLLSNDAEIPLVEAVNVAQAALTAAQSVQAEKKAALNAATAEFNEASAKVLSIFNAIAPLEEKETLLTTALKDQQDLLAEFQATQATYEALLANYNATKEKIAKLTEDIAKYNAIIAAPSSAAAYQARKEVSEAAITNLKQQIATLSDKSVALADELSAAKDNLVKAQQAYDEAKKEYDGWLVYLAPDQVDENERLFIIPAEKPLVEPAVLQGEDYLLFDIFVVDNKGAVIDATQQHRIAIVVPDGKTITKVYHLGDHFEIAEEVQFTQTGNQVVFHSSEFSFYALMSGTPTAPVITPIVTPDTDVKQPVTDAKQPTTVVKKDETNTLMATVAKATTVKAATVNAASPTEKQLPATGEISHPIFSTAVFSVLLGLGLVSRPKRKEQD